MRILLLLGSWGSLPSSIVSLPPVLGLACLMFVVVETIIWADAMDAKINMDD